MAEAHNLSVKAIELLLSSGETKLAQLDRDGLKVRGSDADVIWLKLGTKIDKDLLDSLPRLKCLACNTTGLSHIDLAETERRGITLLSLKGEATFLSEIRATAELTLFLTLALLRRAKQAFTMAESGAWDRMALIGNDLDGKTVGLIGFGRLGRIAAELFLAFRAKVVAFDIADVGPMEGVRMAGLEEVLAASDIVSLHASYAQGQPVILGQEEMSVIKPGALLINTARGELIDETALLAALRSGRLSAALDVLADEQGQDLSQNPLVVFARHSPNLILTPHLGGATRESSEKTEVFMAERIKAWCEANPASEVMG
jgi:D-3-phosphoglycerate dehydrogenase / 2-oxoglutarate reductase